MTNREMALALSSMNRYEFSVEESNAAYNAALAMADWKDERFEAEKQALIDKACEWWESELTYPTMTKADMFYKESLIEEFKQAMKGGEQ